MARIIKKLFRCRRCSLLPIAVPASKRVDVGFFFFLVTRAPMTALYCACLYWNYSDLHLDTGTAHRKWRQVLAHEHICTGMCVYTYSGNTHTFARVLLLDAFGRSLASDAVFALAVTYPRGHASPGTPRALAHVDLFN